MSRWLTLLALVSVGGCFSSDDFSDCERDEQCGTLVDGRQVRQCVANQCVFVDAGVSIDADLIRPDRALPDAAVEVVLTGELTQDDLAELSDRDVVLRDVTALGSLYLSARNIRVEGTLNANGRGGVGGGGGGGGGGGAWGVIPDHSVSRAGGRGGEVGGNVGRQTDGQLGGNGGKGGGAHLGGDGGNREDLDGKPGLDGTFESINCESALSAVVSGVGGGGGGGGAGGPVQEGVCIGGGGGGGGGRGGSGGGAVYLIATETLTLSGQISARGEPAAVGPGDDGGEPCSGEVVNEECRIKNCIDEGIGGDGSSNAGPGQGGDLSAGRGGVGGGGSGGAVRLEGDPVVVQPGFTVDVTGGGANNGGVVVFRGSLNGTPTIVGASGTCPPNL